MTPEKFHKAAALKIEIDEAKFELKTWENVLTGKNTVFTKMKHLPDSIFDSFRHFAILSLKETITLLEKQFDEL